MSRIFLPPNVSRELLEERAAREARAAEALEDHRYAWKKEFDAELQRVDCYLQLVWCPDPAPIEAVAAGATPGRWHIARHNPGAPMSFLVLQTPDGEYLEPGSWVFDYLRASDMWNGERERDREKMIRRLEAEKERRENRERLERQEELAERVKAARDVRISFSDAEKWSQNVAGRRGRKG